LTKTYTSQPFHLSEEDCSSLEVELGSLELNGRDDYVLTGLGMWTQSEEGDHNDYENLAIELSRSVDQDVDTYSNALDIEMDAKYQDQSCLGLRTSPSGSITEVENTEWQTPLPQVHDSRILWQLPSQHGNISADTMVESEYCEDDMGEEHSDKLCLWKG